MKKEIVVKPEIMLPTIAADQQVVGLPMLRDPDLIIANAKKVAVALKKVLNLNPNPFVLNNKRYLSFEDWQFLGGFYGITARVVSTEELKSKIEKTGKMGTLGFLARAEAIRNGVVISAAEAECIRFERNWSYKAFNQRFMLRSMAQTRACAKALRNCLAWVVVLAGYEATPAEEMVSKIPTLPEKLIKPIKRLLRKKKIKDKEVRKYIKKNFGKKSVADLTKKEGEELLIWLGGK